MTEKDIKQIVNNVEEDGEQYSLVAGKLIRLDLFQMGVDDWLSQEASDVASDYVKIADAAMGHAVNSMISRIAGERLIDDLGIEQSERFDLDEIEKFRGSILDTFAVLATYLRVLEIAKEINNEDKTE